MANYRSRPQPFNRVTSSIDEDRMNRSMDIIDSRYQNNVNQTYAAIQQVASIDLLREQDQEHLHNNLKSVIDMIDDTTIDYSKGNVGGELQGYIASAIDKQTLKHAGIAAKYKNFESELAKKKEKNDGTYNDGNRQDALKQAGFYDYMEGNSDNINSLNYTNFVDVNDKMLKTVKQLKDLNPNMPVEIFDPTTGITTKKNVSTLSKAEWQRHIQNSFDDNDKAQLAINGRQSYNYDDALAYSVIEEKRSKLASGFDTEINRLKAMKTASVSDKDKKYYQNQIDAQTRNKTASLTTLDTIPKTAGQIGSFLTQQHMSMDMAEAMSKETILSKKIDYGELNEKAKYLKTLQETKDNRNNVNQGITTKAQPVNTDLGNVDFKSKFEEQKSNSANETRQLLKESYDILKTQEYNGKNVAKEIDILENQVVEEFKTEFGRPPEEFELHRLVLDKADYLLDANTKYKLNQSLLKTEQFFNVEKKAKIKSVDNIISSNSQDFFEQTFDDEKQMVMFDKEGNKTTYGQFLRENGVRDKSSFDSFINADTEQAKLYKANIVFQSLPIGDKTAYRKIKRFLGRASLGGINPVMTTTASFLNYGFKGTEALKYDYAKSVFGERIEKIFHKTAEQEILGRDFINSDRTVRNEGALNNLLENKDFEKEYDKILNIESATISGMNTLIVESDIIKGLETNALREELQDITTLNFDKDRSVGLIDNNDGTITLYQGDEQQVTGFTTSGEPTSGTKTVYRTDVINKSDLSPNNYPELYKQLGTQEDNAQINFFKQANYEKEGVNFYEDSANQGQGLRDLFGGNIDIIEQASKTTADRYIKRNLQRVLAGKQGANQFYKIVDKSIEQSDKFNVSLSTSDRGGYSQVQIKMKTKDWTEENPKYDILYTQPMDSSNEQLNKILHGAPQVMITTLLIQAGNQVGQDNVTLANKIANNLD